MMKTKIITIFVLCSAIALFAYADWSTNQRVYYSGAAITWAGLASDTNIHGSAMLNSDNQVNYTMGYSNSNGKYYNFIIGAASLAAAASGTIVYTVPINTDGYSKASLMAYTSSATGGTLNAEVDSDIITTSGSVPDIGVYALPVPYTIADDAAYFQKVLIPNSATGTITFASNVAAAPTVTDVRGNWLTMAGVRGVYDLQAAQAIVIAVSHNASITNTTTGIWVNLGN